MKYRMNCLAVALVFIAKAVAQVPDSATQEVLPTVIIKAFEQNRRLKDVPAALNYIGGQALGNFNSTSLLSAINTTPGIRMEERSPGSYRINIRGSSLRSPFGVRNIKLYYNDIPFTDPGGQSYLNQLGNYNIHSIEIVKGSNNSIYGAGTGGAMLIESLNEKQDQELFGEYGFGSYGLQYYNTMVTTSSERSINKFGFQYQKSDGYRDQSALHKGIASWNGLFKTANEGLIKTTFLFGDLFYETPGALTRAEFLANPKAARPGTAVAPGAVAAKAHIRQKMFLSGASYEQRLTAALRNKTVLYGMFTEFRNPNLRGYEKTSEPHYGARTIFKFQQSFKNGSLNIDGGAEFQQGFTSVNIHKNVNGNPDSLSSYDDINNQQSILFSQASLDFKSWTLITGISWNTFRLRFQRFVPVTLGRQKRLFNNQISPRFSVMKKYKTVNIYTSIARGFSPPTTDELLPTGGAINLALNAEEGINYDIGVKGSVANNLFIDINVFTYSLHNTIVQRRDAQGGTFFVNAGKTRQNGIETYANYPFLLSSPLFKRSLLWLSHTLHNFHYRQFTQVDNDFSGKALPSVPRNTISTGIDVSMSNGINVGVSYFYSDKIPLNDANTAYAGAYHLLAARIGFEKRMGRLNNKITLGADNILNQHYSLGNDINTFGGRYFNGAPLRNFYLALAISISKNSGITSPGE